MDPSQDARRRLRPLLPACSRGARPSAEGEDETRVALAPKRKNVFAACQLCRKRKVRCDGRFPQCQQCAKQDTHCEYPPDGPDGHEAVKRKLSDVEERLEAHEELYRILQTKPEEESLAIFRRIINGHYVRSILRQIKDGDLLLQVGLFPETWHQYSFPLRAESNCPSHDGVGRILLFCFHFFRPPLVKLAPQHPLPDPQNKLIWYPETWVMYPLARNPIPINHGDHFKAVAEFRTIISEIGAVTFPKIDSRNILSLKEVWVFYCKLKTWYQNLPKSLSIAYAVLPFQLLVHLHYFNVGIMLLEPFTSAQTQGTEGDGTASIPEGSAQEAVADAKI
ncbi:hypothetical protein ACJ41O_001699 [Fusarium nematophilum]